MKRFADTDTLRDPWVRQLSLDAKLVYWYLKENCDAAGVWEPDLKLVNFTFERDIDWPAVRAEMTAPFNQDRPRIEILGNGKWYLTRFIRFQYGKLSEECFPHRKILELLRKHDLLKHWGVVDCLPTTLPATLPTRVVKHERRTTLPGGVPPTPQEEEEEEDKDSDARKHRARTRLDDLFDAIVEVTKVSAGAAAGEVGKARKAILEITPDATPDEVRRRFANCHANHPEWTIGPSALAKWWPESDKLNGKQQEIHYREVS